MQIKAIAVGMCCYKYRHVMLHFDNDINAVLFNVI